MSTNKIILDADETMLLLITKHHAHKDVVSDYQLGTSSYIQECCDYRCFGPNYVGPHADMFTIYLHLCEKLLSVSRFANILSEVNKTPFYESMGLVNQPTLIELMLSALANRRVTDLILDESLIAAKG